MTSFSFTTGNPNNLVANQNASMADIQGPFTDLRTFLNGGTMDETNVPNLSAAFTTYKLLQRGSAEISAGTGSTYALFVGPQFAANAPIVGTAPMLTQIYLDPADYNANSRVTKLRIRFTATVNAVAPAITFTAGLYPIATTGGASGAFPTIASVGTVLAGSTVAVTSPPASTQTTVTGSDFNFPSAGYYALAFATSASTAANSTTDLVAYLQVRQV